MLLLFDIDGTLLRTQGIGLRAIEEAGRGLFGPAFTTRGVEVAGRLDPLIFSEMLRNAGAPDTPESHARLRAAYTDALEAELARDPSVATAMPGVHELLARLGRVANQGAGTKPVTLGVLTGNFERTGRAKMRACGIDPEQFVVSVWGDDSPHTPPHRDHLVPVGMARSARVRGGQPATGREVVVIGDTPHDVRCARVHGCRSLAVATGQFGVEELAASGADWAVADLSRTDAVVEWMLEGWLD
jgi:phosphoglycolate phosphatase-like HAD superfamily hydrolase